MREIDSTIPVLAVWVDKAIVVSRYKIVSVGWVVISCVVVSNISVFLDGVILVSDDKIDERVDIIIGEVDETFDSVFVDGADSLVDGAVDDVLADEVNEMALVNDVFDNLAETVDSCIVVIGCLVDWLTFIDNIFVTTADDELVFKLSDVVFSWGDKEVADDVWLSVSAVWETLVISRVVVIDIDVSLGDIPTEERL